MLLEQLISYVHVILQCLTPTKLNVQLLNIQKFHYLRLSLQGVAADTIKSLQVCDINYKLAWQLLTERFENKHLLVNNHMKALFTLPTLTRESHEGLRQLLDGIQKHLLSLNVLGCPTKHWDDLVVYLTSTKFDNTIRRAWESQNNSGKLPTVEHLLNFLKDRCCILESMATNSDTKQKQDSFKSSQRNKTSRSFLTLSNKDKCTLCNKEHNI